MKLHSSAQSVKSRASSCFSFEGDSDLESSTCGVYGGSPDKSSSPRTLRSRSSKLMKRFMNSGAKNANRRLIQNEEVRVLHLFW